MTRAAGVILAVMGLGVSSASGQTIETGFLNRTLTLDGAAHRFQVYVPRDYQPSQAWPVILALHGGGERGTDGLIQTDVGLGRAIRRHADRFPALVVFPQRSPEGTPAGWHGIGARVALAALDQTLAEFKGDTSRVYLTGLSLGGNGSWYLGYHHGDRFAAAVIICGWVSERRPATGTAPVFPGIAPDSEGDPFAAVARKVARLPIWIFHGDADAVVAVAESRGMAEALRALKADVQYTELPGVDHNSWDTAYDRADVIEWLFKQRRP
jgi:predicted peptidase